MSSWCFIYNIRGHVARTRVSGRLVLAIHVHGLAIVYNFKTKHTSLDMLQDYVDCDLRGFFRRVGIGGTALSFGDEISENGENGPGACGCPYMLL